MLLFQTLLVATFCCFLWPFKIVGIAVIHAVQFYRGALGRPVLQNFLTNKTSKSFKGSDIEHAKARIFLFEDKICS